MPLIPNVLYPQDIFGQKINDLQVNQINQSFFEIIFSTIIRVNEEIKEKKEIEKIILCDVQKEIYPNIETSFLNLLHNSGYPEVKFEKKIDFEKLYSQKFN